MKKFLALLVTMILLTGFYSCEKTEDGPSTEFCNNGVKDGLETEIDCGGVCDSCAPFGVVNCTLGNTVFNSTRSDRTFGEKLGNSFRIHANDGRPMYFMFKPEPVGQISPIFAISFEYRGEAYTLEPGDMGEVVITQYDTLHDLIGGTFWFSAGRVTGPDTTSARNGTFTNIRCKGL